MNRLIDSFKMAYVGFAENMKLNYRVKLSTGAKFSRSGATYKVVSKIYDFHGDYRKSDDV